MKRIAFVFKSAPYGSSAGREGLDALLAVSTLTSNIGVFFIGDGVFQILVRQQPDIVLVRNYIATFRVLPMYDINTIVVCKSSLQERGLGMNCVFVLDATVLSAHDINEKIMQYHVILTF